MSCHYISVCTVYLDQTNSRTAYGIAAVEDQDGHLIVLASYCDLTADPALIDELVHLCRRLQPSLLHLPDIVDDFLAAF